MQGDIEGLYHDFMHKLNIVFPICKDKNNMHQLGM